jgi:uncharacterized protein
MLAAFLALALAGPPVDPTLLRSMVGDVALEQVRAFDPRWNADQRDCAGLVRFAYHEAWRRLDPSRLDQPLWLDGQGKPASFADAETLLQGSFVNLGRDERAMRDLHTGDLLAFRQGVIGSAEESIDPLVFHLMLVVRSGDQTLLVYHPGAKDSPVRVGTLCDILRAAPLEWRPTSANQSFLGFYRFHAFAAQGENP